MRNIYLIITGAMLAISGFSAHAQQITGDLQMNYGFYRKDSAILLNSPSTPQADNLKSGGEGWLSLNYNKDDFAAGLRLDIYNNSALINPQVPTTKQGIGFWYVTKTIHGLTITGGYFYEQYGSGIVLRAYEDRGLGIDYAIAGVKLKYDLSSKWHIRAFTGQQKNFAGATTNALYAPIMKGACLDGELKLGKVQLLPGASFLNRTIDQGSMNAIIATIETYNAAQQFVPKYNMYAGSLFNTLNAGNFSWYAEGAYKSREAIADANGNLINKDGNVEYTSLSYSVKSFGVTAQAKRTDDFVMRTSPNETLLNGVLNYLPPMSQQNSLRLPARYQPATQTLGEMAYQADMVFTPASGYSVNLNYSDIKDLNNVQLWREAFASLDIRTSKTVQYSIGMQYVLYDYTVYRSEPGYPNVIAYTPFASMVYKFNRKKSIHCELQYQNTKQDYGSWLYGSVEYDIAPKWSFAISDMYLVDPNPEKTNKNLHFYNAFLGYTFRTNRFTIEYARQTDGINCSGGVCRYEPAFSGVKMSITSTF